MQTIDTNTTATTTIDTLLNADESDLRAWAATASYATAAALAALAWLPAGYAADLDRFRPAPRLGGLGRGERTQFAALLALHRLGGAALSPDVVEAFVDSVNREARLLAARAKHLGPDLAERLSRDRDWQVRRDLAMRPDLDPSLRARMLRDSDSYVRSAAESPRPSTAMLAS